jgi:hypothetical protein
MEGLLGSIYGLFTGGGSSRRQLQDLDIDGGFGRDVAVDEDITVFDSERVQLNQAGEVVGLAATIGNGGLELREGKLTQRQPTLCRSFLSVLGERLLLNGTKSKY